MLREIVSSWSAWHTDVWGIIIFCFSALNSNKLLPSVTEPALYNTHGFLFGVLLFSSITAKLNVIHVLRQTSQSLRRARLPSWGLWWQLCVRQQWKVSTSTPGGGTSVIWELLIVTLTPLTLLRLTDDNASCRVDTAIIQKRLPVLLKYLNSDTERQLQALYALQALIVSLDQPPSKCYIKLHVVRAGLATSPHLKDHVEAVDQQWSV